jgi:hypothetical protein
MKNILDIGLITGNREVFNYWVEVNKNAKACFWRIHDFNSIRGVRFDIILKIDCWEDVPYDVIEDSFARLKNKK